MNSRVENLRAVTQDRTSRTETRERRASDLGTGAAIVLFSALSLSRRFSRAPVVERDCWSVAAIRATCILVSERRGIYP